MGQVKQGADLEGFAEAHFVREDAVEAIFVQGYQPLDSVDLFRDQLRHI